MQALAKRKATKDVVNYYVMFQTDDWEDEDLSFSFTDAAGLCDGEMHAALHWLEVILRAEWTTVAAIAKKHGVSITKPEKTKQDPIFFISGSKLGYSHTTAEPPADHELWFFPADGGAKRVPLAKAPKADRERLRELIVNGTCACELCQPDQPKVQRAPGKPPKPVALAGAPSETLATAKLWPGYDPKALPPGRVVALDCAERVPESMIRALPSHPLLALSFRGRGMRAVLPEISQLKHLQVLSLKGCDVRQPIGDALSGLQDLRALEIDTMTKQAYEGSFWDLPKLELLDMCNWESLPRMAKMKRQRHFVFDGTVKAKAVAHLPLESVIIDDEVEILADWPLRFVQIATGRKLPPNESVRFVDLGYKERSVPDWVRELPNLTGLSARWAEELPDWLAKMPKLQVLVLAHSDALAKAPEKFKVIERLKHLRVLTLAPNGGNRVPFDLSALKKLEYLSVTWTKARTPREFVTGFEHVKHLYFSTGFSKATKEAFLKKHAFAKEDGNVFRLWDLLTYYRWLLGPSDPAHWLARFATSTEWPAPPKIAV